MGRGLRVEDLDPENAAQILAGLERKAVGRSNGAKPKFVKSKPATKRHRSWHVVLIQAVVYAAAYMLLGIGWFLEHVGRGIYLLAREMKDAARNID